jgi:hypothetical protein
MQRRNTSRLVICGGLDSASRESIPGLTLLRSRGFGALVKLLQDMQDHKMKMRAWRTSKNMTLEGLRARLAKAGYDVSISKLSRLENGLSVHPDVELCRAIERMSGCKVPAAVLLGLRKR